MATSRFEIGEQVTLPDGGQGIIKDIDNCGHNGIFLIIEDANGFLTKMAESNCQPIVVPDEITYHWSNCKHYHREWDGTHSYARSSELKKINCPECRAEMRLESQRLQQRAEELLEAANIPLW